MRKHLYFIFIISVTISTAQSVVISEAESDPDPSSILDVQSSTKGMLVPRMTLSERIDIAAPAAGLFVYQTDDVIGFYSYDGSGWSYLINSNQVTDFGSGAVITDAERDKLEGIDVTGLVPSGTIVPFGGTKDNVPSGWLLCDGQPYANTTYPGLREAIGTAWGGSTDIFNVPDLRGYFLRGVDDGEGNDPDAADRTNLDGDNILGDVVGSYQADELESHTHSSNASFGTTSNWAGGGNVAPLTHGAATIDPFGGSETRPKNAYVNYIIKV